MVERQILLAFHQVTVSLNPSFMELKRLLSLLIAGKEYKTSGPNAVQCGAVPVGAGASRNQRLHRVGWENEKKSPTADRAVTCDRAAVGRT